MANLTANRRRTAEQTAVADDVAALVAEVFGDAKTLSRADLAAAFGLRAR